MSKTHEALRHGDTGRFLKDTPANRRDRHNTIERVPNPGRGDTKGDKKDKRSL